MITRNIAFRPGSITKNHVFRVVCIMRRPCYAIIIEMDARKHKQHIKKRERGAWIDRHLVRHQTTGRHIYIYERIAWQHASEMANQKKTIYICI